MRNEHGFDTIILTASDNKTSATIVPARGATVTSLQLPFASGTRETLFLHDFAWDKDADDLIGGIPFLFPVCARISRNNQAGIYLYDGKQYQLKIHGFSWYSFWEVGDISSDMVILTLKDSDETRARFPFRFHIQLQFKVTPGKLECHQIYRNLETTRAMPYYAGFHPYFLTPPANAGKDKVMLQAEFTRRLQYNADLTDIIGELPPIKTPVSVSTPDINEQLCMLGDNKIVTLSFPNGDSLKTNVYCESNPDLFSYMQLYTIPEKPFFCAERWMSFANAMNTVAGVQWLQPGESQEAVFVISV